MCYEESIIRTSLSGDGPRGPYSLILLYFLVPLSPSEPPWLHSLSRPSSASPPPAAHAGSVFTAGGLHICRLTYYQSSSSPSLMFVPPLLFWTCLLCRPRWTSKACLVCLQTFFFFFSYPAHSGAENLSKHASCSERKKKNEKSVLRVKADSSAELFNYCILHQRLNERYRIIKTDVMFLNSILLCVFSKSNSYAKRLFIPCTVTKWLFLCFLLHWLNNGNMFSEQNWPACVGTKPNTKTWSFFFPIAKYLSSKRQTAEYILHYSLGSSPHFLIEGSRISATKQTEQFAKDCIVCVCVVLLGFPAAPCAAPN